MSRQESWRQEVLDKLDIAEEYRLLGLKIEGSPNAKGWIPCPAFDKPDQKTPSANINVGSGSLRGVYKDFREACSMDLFAFAIHVGKFKDFSEAKKEYAIKAGVKLGRGRSVKRIEDRFEWKPWHEGLASMWLKTKQGISCSAMKRSGVKFAVFGHKPVFTIPIWGVDFGIDTVGYLVFCRSGNLLEVRKKNSDFSSFSKCLTPRIADSTASWVGMEAMAIEDAEVVIKTEGYTDMLAVMSIMPSGLLGKHVVVTNANGCNEIPNEIHIASVAGKRVFVVHDADAPGRGKSEAGQETSSWRWCDSLASTASEVRNVILPFDVSKDHGKDIRDWIIEEAAKLGVDVSRPLDLTENQKTKIYDLFMVMVNASPTVAKTLKPNLISGSAAYMDSQEVYFNSLLVRAGIDVLGEDDEHTIYVYSRCTLKVSRFSEQVVSTLLFTRLLHAGGRRILETVAEPGEEAGDKIPLSEIRKAIILAANKTVKIDNWAGAGIWRGFDKDGQSTDSVILVNKDSAGCLNGAAKLERVTIPRFEGRVLDFRTIDDPWFEFDEMASLINKAITDKNWAKDTVHGLTKTFSDWGWSRKSDSVLISGLVLATFVQSFLSWRPYVLVTGKANSGKTTLMEFCAGLFGKLAFLSGNYSEAGLRQKLGSKCFALFLDEFEDSPRCRLILEALRSSSRGAGESIRGQASHQSKSFCYRQIPWLSAINPGIMEEADKTRTITLETIRKGQDRTLNRLPSEGARRKLGLELVAIACVNVIESLKIYESLREVGSARIGLSQRMVENYAVPVSLLGAVFELGESGSKTLLEQLLSEIVLTESNVSDEEELLAALLMANFRHSRGDDANVAEALTDNGVISTERQDALERHGVRRMVGRDGSLGLFVAKDARKLLKGTRFEKMRDPIHILRLIPGASKSRQRCAGSLPWGVLIPWDHVLEQMS